MQRGVGAVQFNCSVLVQVVLQRSSNAIGWDLEWYSVWHWVESVLECGWHIIAVWKKGWRGRWKRWREGWRRWSRGGEVEACPAPGREKSVCALPLPHQRPLHLAYTRRLYSPRVMPQCAPSQAAHAHCALVELVQLAQAPAPHSDELYLSVSATACKCNFLLAASVRLPFHFSLHNPLEWSNLIFLESCKHIYWLPEKLDMN